MFKAKDTTRIYVYPMKPNEYKRVDTLEYYIVDDMPKQYKLNVLSGGKPDFLLKNNLSLIPEEDSNNEDSEAGSESESNESGMLKFILSFYICVVIRINRSLTL